MKTSKYICKYKVILPFEDVSNDVGWSCNSWMLPSIYTNFWILWPFTKVGSKNLIVAEFGAKDKSSETANVISKLLKYSESSSVRVWIME